MPPPGRRKPLRCFLPLLALLCFVLGANAASAALGVDFGTEYIKAAVAKPGSPLEIVLTKDSKRKEAASIAFKPSRAQLKDKDAFPDRLYGADALAVSARYPADVYSNLKPLLGIAFSDPSVRTYTRRFPGLRAEELSHGGDLRTSIGFKSRALDETNAFTIEELLGMQLKNIKANAEAAVGRNNFVSDVVITYPAFYTAEEKRALELAAEFAGLKVLGLITDGQAVGLNYAATRASTPEPEYHIVYDMGAGSTTASVLRFHGKSLKGPNKKNQTVQEVQVLGVGFDKTLGGDALNDLIVQDMITKFLDMSNIKTMGVEDVHLRADGKTMARLWKDAEKIRQVLSANTQASATLEGLYYEDVTLKYKLTRHEFEMMASSYARRVAAPLNSALAQAGLGLNDISSVIMFGGMTRTPFVQAELERAVSDTTQVKANVNADESAAFGAALRAAALSPSFRVKDIRVADFSGQTYNMKWVANGKERSQKIFLDTSITGLTKQVQINSLESLSVSFEQVPKDAGPATLVQHFEIANLTKSVQDLRSKYGCADANITTTLNVRLSPVDGIPEVISGAVDCVAQKGKEGGVVDSVKGLFGFGKKGDQEPMLNEELSVEDEILPRTPEPIDDPTSSATIVSMTEISSTGQPSGPTPTSSTKSAKVTNPLVVIPLLVQQSLTLSWPKKDITDIKSRLTAFDLSDKNSILRSEALNILEAFTYRARDYLDDQNFKSFSSDATRTRLSEQLTTVSDWLYGEGVDAKLRDFQDQLKSLKALVEPVLSRMTESAGREKALESLRSSLNGASSMVDRIKEQVKQAAAKATNSVGSIVSSVSTEALSMASSTIDDDDDLDAEPYNTANAEEKETNVPPPPKLYEFTAEDLSSLEKSYEETKKWLDDKVALQEKLSAFDDPAVLVADLESKAKALTSRVTDLIMKQIKMQTPPKAKKPKKAKTVKAKTSSTSTVPADDAPEGATSIPSPTPATKDEL